MKQDEIKTDPQWWDRYRRMQAMYDTREDKRRRPTLAMAVVAILLVAATTYGLLEYWQFFMDQVGSKYD